MIHTLACALQPEHAVSGFDRVLFGAYDEFDSFDPPTRAAVHLLMDAMPDADLIAGHISYATLRDRYSHARLATVLREPLSRLLSFWLFWRGHIDEQLQQWGSWGDRVRLSRQPLETFLSLQCLACQNDNQAIRMLLSPHPLIPLDGFIAAEHDDQLLSEAHQTLSRFSFVDVVENPALVTRLGEWLGNACVTQTMNETALLPVSVRGQLEKELTPKAFFLLDRHCRLDLELWSTVVRQRMAEHDPLQLRLHIACKSTARFARVMAGT